MPRRSTGSSESPAPRRQSARIAASVSSKLTTPSPVKQTPKRASKRVSKGAVVLEDDAKLNGNEEVSQEVSDSEQQIEKKQKLEYQGENKEMKTSKPCEQDSKEEPIAVDSEKNIKASPDAGFEVVDKSDVPNPESAEVKAAISAQGEDGQLLVNYVQVSKDEVPPSNLKGNTPSAKESTLDATAAAPPPNGIETAVGDAVQELTGTANKVTENEVDEKPAADAHQKAVESQNPAVAPNAETPVSQ